MVKILSSRPLYVLKVTEKKTPINLHLKYEFAISKIYFIDLHQVKKRYIGSSIELYA